MRSNFSYIFFLLLLIEMNYFYQKEKYLNIYFFACFFFFFFLSFIHTFHRDLRREDVIQRAHYTAYNKYDKIRVNKHIFSPIIYN